jgi:hypothetical protein
MGWSVNIARACAEEGFVGLLLRLPDRSLRGCSPDCDADGRDTLESAG